MNGESLTWSTSPSCFNGEKHQAEGFGRGHAGDANGVVHVMAMRCAHQFANERGHRPARKCRARLGPAGPHVSGPDRGTQPLSQQCASLPSPCRICRSAMAAGPSSAMSRSSASVERFPDKAFGVGARTKHRHERSRPQYRPDADEPALRRKNPLRRNRAARRRCAAKDAAACTAVRRNPARQRETRTRISTACSRGRHRANESRFRRCWAARGSCCKR